MALSNRDGILDALRTIVVTADRHVGRVGEWWWSVLREVERANTLEPILRSDPSLAAFNDEWMRADGTGTSRLSMTSLISWLVRRALEIGATEAIGELEQYLASSTYACRFAVGIRGVAVERQVKFGDDVLLLPSSAEIARVESTEARPATTAALEFVMQFPKIAAPAGAKWDTFTPAEAARQSAAARLSRARGCIALAIDGPVVETASTAAPTESIPPSGGRGASVAIGTGGVPVRPLSGAVLDEALRIHNRLITLPGTMADRLTIAAHRWHNSLLRGTTPDLFIDVGIGLESVFLPDESSELKHRLSIRGARLLGNDMNDRVRLSKAFDLLYDARSHAVHKGRLLTKMRHGVARDNYDLAVLGQRLLRAAILAMINRGRDDWEEIIFG